MQLLDDFHGQKFGCILADPPWHFKSWSSKGTGRSAEQHYSVMDLKSIKELDVAEICEKNSCLFLWVVDCQLPQGLDVMAAWGFKFKTVAFTWVKQTPRGIWHFGHGYWSRSGTEQCLLGTKGSPRPLSHSVRQVVIAKRREHSRKPDEVRSRIEQLAAGPRLELFARERVSGWSCWGLETDKFGVVKNA